MRTNFVLIDAENVKPEYIEKLNHDHFRVVVFVGANIKRVDFAMVKALQALGSNGCYIQISGIGSDALDFHIAYYIGKLSAVEPGAYFHIISKDKGFDPLIKHLKDQNIFCARSASVMEIPLVRSTTRLTPKQRAADFYEKRIAPAKTRPGTVTSLQGAIRSHFHNVLSEEDVSKVLDSLTASGHVILNGKRVAYPDRV